MVQNPSAKQLVDPEDFNIESKSLRNGKEQKAIVVDLNEQALTESVIKLALKHSKPTEQSPDSSEKLILNKLMMEHFILNNPYREHNVKNFDDKIFFYEPINKYYDLLGLKKLVFTQIVSTVSQNPGLIDVEKVSQTLKALEKESVEGKTKDTASEDIRLTENCLQLEDKIHKYMLRALGQPGEQQSFQTSSYKFLDSLKNQGKI
uniref:Uncharacterized protein n=1 Tax=Strombidium rassoulzadegani TaxID=1082188 RepID=A0A7S3FSW8_9SPIT